MRTTFDIGNEAEGIVLGHYIKAGLRVCIPFGTGAPYDLAVDTGTRIVKVQVKTATFEKGCIVCKTRRRNANYDRTMRRYEKGEVDYFAIYCPQLNELYGMSFEAAKGSASLRIEPTLNKQEKYIRWAKNYCWDKHIAELKDEWRGRESNSRPTGYESVALTI
jgi:PD-(D/E)XK endonuclease